MTEHLPVTWWTTDPEPKMLGVTCAGCDPDARDDTGTPWPCADSTGADPFAE